MISLLYPKLALTNIFKNKSTYFPYMLTSIVCVMTSYCVTYIASHEGLSQVPGGAITLTLFFLGTLVVDSFSYILIFYTNSFLIKRRKKELGLYCVLGMEKIHVAFVLFFEIFFTAIICLALGLLFGVLFSRLMFLALLYIMDFTTPFAFSISVPTIIATIIIFLIVYGLTLIYDLRSLRMAKPVELLHGGQKGEKEPKSSWILTLIGLLTLGGGYFIAVYFKSPAQALMLFFFAVMLVIIGTFCLFTSGSIALLKILRRNKRFYYKPANFISVSGMMYRMKQNASGLAAICILSTMVLVTVSSTVCLYAGRADMLNSMFPREINITLFREDEDTKDTDIDAALAQGLADSGLTAVNRTSCHSLTINVLQEDGVYGRKANPTSMMDTTFSLVPLSDYNAIEGVEPVSLAPDEAIIYPIGGFPTDTVNLGGNVLRIVDTIKKNPFSNVGTYDGATGAVLVVADEQVRPLFAALGGYPDTPFTYGAGFDVADATPQQCAQLANLIRNYAPRNVTCRSAIAAEWDSMYGSFLFLGVFLGSLFLMATVLIIYYKQISEGYDDHERFTIMQQVGMSQKEVRKAINKIMLVFFLPLAASALHMVFASFIIRRVLLVFSLNNLGLFLFCTAATFLIFSAVYILVYRITARAYYRLANA